MKEKAIKAFMLAKINRSVMTVSHISHRRSQLVGLIGM